MNQLTERIKSKGYTLKEFLKKINYSLSWYRVHEKKEAKRHAFLVGLIDELEVKL